MVLGSSKLIDNVEPLFEAVALYNIGALPRVKKAYLYAQKFHAHQVRKSGELYIIHPVNVAYTLAVKGADEATICACLLHDIIEDTPVTYEELVMEFGTEVADLVNGVTNLSEINFSTKEAEDIANLRKVLLGLIKDPRIVLIKMSDRLHNMRTLEYQKPEKQVAKAEETLHFYAPLASFLGLDCFKNELEDLSLKYIDSRGYDTTAELITSLEDEIGDTLNEMLVNISIILKKNDIPSDVVVRIKHTYGVYKRIKAGQTPYDIHDLLALKVLVTEIEECYKALGLIHSLYPPVNVKFKDFICSPKKNMYQALHTTVYSPNGYLVQNRIKTYDMDIVDQNGLISFWNSNKGMAREAMMRASEENFQFLRGIKVMDEAYPNDYDFIHHVKTELFDGKIVVLTPSGRTVELPIGATPVDVAFFLGDTTANYASHAIVNEVPVPFNYKLHEYDRVQIMMTPGHETDKGGWEEYATTTKAMLGLKRQREMRK